MYLFWMALGMLAMYFVLYAFFPYFAEGRLAAFTKRSAMSVTLIVAAIVVGYMVVLHTRNLELGNRILHIWNGGFVTFFACYRAARDSAARLGRFQFLVLAALIVTSLGVANEVMEFALQSYGLRVFLRTPYDTWLDLTSNTLGVLIACAVFAPFAKKPVERLEP